MINPDLDKELVALTKEKMLLEERIAIVEDQIESLEDERDDISNDIDKIDSQIDEIKKLLMSQKIEELNIETTDPFMRDFIAASYFCSKEDVRPLLQTVNIKETVLQACDGYKAIVIKSNTIPDNFKNTKIKWDVREDLESHVNEIVGEYINLDSVYPPKENYTYKLENVTSEEFYSLLKSEKYERNTLTEIVILHTDKRIGVNKENIDIGLMAFKGEKFNLYTSSPVAPMLLENENKSVLVLPVRLLEG